MPRSVCSSTVACRVSDPERCAAADDPPSRRHRPRRPRHTARSMSQPVAFHLRQVHSRFDGDCACPSDKCTRRCGQTRQNPMTTASRPTRGECRAAGAVWRHDSSNSMRGSLRAPFVNTGNLKVAAPIGRLIKVIECTGRRRHRSDGKSVQQPGVQPPAEAAQPCAERRFDRFR